MNKLFKKVNIDSERGIFKLGMENKDQVSFNSTSLPNKTY